jgi:hypothetical protein
MTIKNNSLPHSHVATKRPIHWGAFFLLIALSITVYLGTHAYLQHREEAEQTRNCIQQNGVWKVYREPDGKTFHWLCRDALTGTIFDLIVEKINETLYREKSAFSPKDGKWDTIQDWLSRGDKRGGKWVNPPDEAIQLIEP